MNNYDLLIIGGGIHGCAAAAHAARRGLNVLLVEKGDLASQTSSASSKLIHGGLRYLEQGEWKLVSEALKARHHLLSEAPHLVHPLPFVLPYRKTDRAKWQLRFGLSCYDFLSRRDKLPRSRLLNAQKSPDFFCSLHAFIEEAFIYYDAHTDDARLTLENALLAQSLGAKIRTYTEFTAAYVQDKQWQVTLSPEAGQAYSVTAKGLINTAGPWINQILDSLGVVSKPSLTLVKGSHLILPALYPGNHAYILQHTDGRIVFCKPYHGFTMVGTTELPYTKPVTHVTMDESEAHYLCELLTVYFKKPVSTSDILHHWSGVRTLLSQQKDSLSDLSRTIHLHLTAEPAPIATLYGGKLTTHQHTAHQLVNALFPSSDPMVWPTFPGAFCEDKTFKTEVTEMKQKYAWLPTPQLARYIHQYGTRTKQLLADCEQLSDLGQPMGQTLFSKEIDFLCEHEWARTVDDIIWRRTQLGLVLSEDEKIKIEKYIKM